jgi:hypothetical protein
MLGLGSGLLLDDPSSLHLIRGNSMNIKEKQN